MKIKNMEDENYRVHVVYLDLCAVDENGKEYKDFYIHKMMDGKYYAFPTEDGCMITTDKMLEIRVGKS